MAATFLFRKGRGHTEPGLQAGWLFSFYFSDLRAGSSRAAAPVRAFLLGVQ
jgi:hypothetical protein